MKEISEINTTLQQISNDTDPGKRNGHDTFSIYNLPADALFVIYANLPDNDSRFAFSQACHRFLQVHVDALKSYVGDIKAVTPNTPFSDVQRIMSNVPGSHVPITRMFSQFSEDHRNKLNAINDRTSIDALARILTGAEGSEVPIFLKLMDRASGNIIVARSMFLCLWYYVAGHRVPGLKLWFDNGQVAFPGATPIVLGNGDGDIVFKIRPLSNHFTLSFKQKEAFAPLLSLIMRKFLNPSKPAEIRNKIVMMILLKQAIESTDPANPLLAHISDTPAIEHHASRIASCFVGMHVHNLNGSLARAGSLTYGKVTFAKRITEEDSVLSVAF